MSQMMDRQTGSPDEEGALLKNSGNGAVNEKFGTRSSSLWNSIRRIAEKSPLSPGGKGSKVTSEVDESGSELPPLPSPSSPLKNGGEHCLKKEEDEGDVTPQTSKGLKRSITDPNTLVKRLSSIRRSMTFSTKKENNKNAKQELLVPVSVDTAEEKKADKEEEVQFEETEEAYVLPEIPHTPLSVMQISKLIELEELEEAHLNLLALRQEFQQERQCSGEDSSMELSKKEKDLNLLYGDLRNRITTIVCDSNSLPSSNKLLLVHVARIIQEEERRAEEPGGLPGSWMESWREAVGEDVCAKVKSVQLERQEQNTSWLAVHLGLLGKAIVEDLERVRRELRRSYPPSFKVFSVYVSSYHRVVGQHLKKLEQQVTELKDLYSLLDWILNRYKSERIMGSASLQPDLKGEGTDLQLEDNLLEQLKNKYCSRVKEDMRSALNRITQLEKEEVWADSKTPDIDEGFLNSPIPMDIWTKVKGTIKNSGQLDAQLELKVISSCLEELKEFPKRFVTEFRHHCSALRQTLCTEYQITYINSFTSLQQHMEVYRDTCPDQVEGFKKEVKWLIVRLMEDLEDQFKEDVKPYLRRMMTRKWLNNDEDFKQLQDRTKLLSQHCSFMRPPNAQEFASRLHYHVVREYIGQLMKNNYSCKNRKHEKAAAKIRLQWRDLTDLFREMDSTHEWLHHVGNDLSNIIGEINKAHIKNQLGPIVQHYPDFSKKHMVAVLHFRGILRGREHQLILQRLSKLREKPGSSGDNSRILFADMQVTVNTDCFSIHPCSCLNILLPDD